jgi:hypothetical protein
MGVCMSKFKRAAAAAARQSWSLIEKVEIANAICADVRFSHAEARACVVMILYFHNTTSGELFPSRKQIMERACVTKEVVIAATRKLRRLGFITYEESTGGFSRRNTYHLKKRSEIPTLLTKKGQLSRPLGSEKLTHCGSEKLTHNYPENLSLEDSDGSPLPRKGEASPSQEGFQGMQVAELVKPSEAEREARIAELEKKLGRKIGDRRQTNDI